jgi:hypothetical protein
VQVVAARPTAAIHAKLMQMKPRQRSILTWVWLALPFAHRSTTELLVKAVAVRLPNAATEAALTTIERVVVPDAPLLSVTVNDAVYVPGVE